MRPKAEIEGKFAAERATNSSLAGYKDG